MSEFMNKLKCARQLVGCGKVSRRDFIQLALAAGVTVPAAQSLFAGAARAHPWKGGLFRIAIGHGSTTDSLDPATYPDQFTGAAMWGTLSNSLTEVDAKGDVFGDLAESFEPSRGAQRWAFRLRRGLTFHDGRPVTADDVVGSLRHHMGPDSQSAAKALLAPITSLRADGPHMVVVELENGNADFPYILSDYHLPIMPVIEGHADWTTGNRTGAYVLDRFEPGVRATFTRNPHYHKSGRAHFDAVEALVITDDVARTNALTSGDVHYMDRCDLKTLGRLRQTPGIAISEVAGYGHYVYAMDVTQAPFDDVNVRLALKHSLDREEIVRKVFFGHGVPGNDNPIAPSVKYAIDPEPRHAYDPDKARSYLKKAGLQTLKVDISASDAAFDGCVDGAVLWKEHARKAGIDINVVREAGDGYWDKVWGKRGCFGSYWAGRPTPDWMFSSVYAADAAWNETSWAHPRFNELMATARSETDEARRAAMYAEMQQLVHDDGGVVNLMFNTYVDAHADTLAHDDLAANWPMDGLRVAERWWFSHEEA